MSKQLTIALTKGRILKETLPLLADSPFRESVRITPTDEHGNQGEDGMWVFPVEVCVGDEALDSELRMVPYRDLWQEQRTPKRHGDYGFFFQNKLR